MTAVALHLVTVLFNSPEVLPEFFASLAGQRGIDFHLHVLDNSTDPATGVAAQAEIARLGLADRVGYVRNAGNVGVAAANNQGIRLALAAGARHVLLLNNDIEFSNPTLLQEMVAVSVERGQPLVVPKMLYYDAPLIWCAGGHINRWIALVRHYGDGEPDNHRHDRSRRVGYSPTCFMLIDSSVFASVGLMDEKYFVYYDDTDFIWRCAQRSIFVYYWAEGSIRHKVSTSTGGHESPFTRYYATRNRLYFIGKNLPRLNRLTAYLYFFLTRPLKRDFWNRESRATVMRAIRDARSL